VLCGVMVTRSLFATCFYEALLGDAALMAELERSCRDLAREDKAGRAWSAAHAYPGYTSYASLNDLPQRDPVFDDLKRALDSHIRAFAVDAHFDFGGKRPKLDSLWVNILKPGGMHSGHIHPHSAVSGTIYVRVPPGAGALKLEDPRLAMMMAAPSRLPDAPEALQPFIYTAPKKGMVLLWESWLRHEVVAGTSKSDRISISFNYR
jgi:uncharacterized protein (TIGR02466 family)